MASNSVQLTVDGDCDCLMQESTDVVLCLSDGWEAKTINGTKFVLGTIVSVNEKCTSVKKGNCYYPGVKSCEYIVDILLDQFETLDEDSEEVWEPEDDDVESVTKSNCFFNSIVSLITTNMRLSDDEQNLITPLSDGLLVPQVTIVSEYATSDEQTAFPITASVTITNPSTFLPMRVIGSVHFWGRFTLIASATARTIERDLEVDGTSAFGGPEIVGFIPSATSSVMNSNFEWSESIGIIFGLDDTSTFLEAGESKTYSLTIAGTMVAGDSIDAINCFIDLQGINYSPFVP